jgi:hypothetical protein
MFKMIKIRMFKCAERIGFLMLPATRLSYCRIHREYISLDMCMSHTKKPTYVFHR